MNTWLSDTNPLQHNNHAGFNASSDPSMAFLPPTSINPPQFPNQRFLNGANRNSSPGFHDPIYQVNPVIPSKRPREGSIGTSPRQVPGGLPGSRSQTPGHGAYPGFNPNANGTPHFPNVPTPYQHLQAGATSNTTPSPTVSQLNFNHPGGPQRVATASPSPFSPHHGGPQMSPAHPEHISRVGTPHDNPNGYMQGNAYGQPMNQMQQFPQSIPSGASQMQINPQLGLAQQHMQAQSAQRHAYEVQLAQARQLQQARAAQHSQARPPSSGMNNLGVQMPNPQAAAMQYMQQQGGRPANPEAFVKQLQAFMAQRGQPVDINPFVCGRSLPLVGLYAAVVKGGGSIKITKMNQWPIIAQQFGFPPQQQGIAAQELRSYWMRNLGPYESVWMARQHNKAVAAQGMQNQMHNQMSPTRNSLAAQDAISQNHNRTLSDHDNLKLNGALQNSNQQPSMNGYIPPSQLKNQQAQQSSILQHKARVSQEMDGGQVNGLSAQFPIPSPAGTIDSDKAVQQDPATQMPAKIPLEDPFKPDILPVSHFHGPIDVDEMYQIAQGLLELKPVVPSFRELGVIDIHALTMSIKCGLHAETRMALDTLVNMSVEPNLQLSLDNCDDLVESLIDCAQDQLDFLAENATEVSDEMLISSYEDVVRGCRVDAETLQDIPEFGSLDYDLNRAVDRLICITTLIRNFSFYESNFNSLGMPEVVRFLTNVIRHLGTKELLLRSHRNTLDFMKDVIIYLSNLSHSIQLPGKEEALCLLHFLLSFAPCPPPVSAASNKATFAMYNPNIHKYMPSAVDSLAKLLARDEPNRTYYKAIFSADAASSPPYELLTRTFGLAISPIPTAHPNQRAVVEARKPFLLQGMLAAEILSNLAPSSDHGLARSWLESTDGFAATLLRLISILSMDRSTQVSQQHRPPPPGQRSVPPAEADPNAYRAITHRGLAVLKRLADKSRIGSDNGGEVKIPVPGKESLLGAMVSKDIDPVVLRQLCIYTGLEE